MKRTDIRKIFTGRKKALAGCLAAVIVLAGGFNVWQSSQVPEFPDFTDPVVETTITEDDTPLASKPKVTTKTTSNTKTTRKKVKLKKAATKTYTKKLPTTNKKSTTTKKTNRNTTVKTLKTVKTATTQKYTKKSKTAVQTRKVNYNHSDDHNSHGGFSYCRQSECSFHKKSRKHQHGQQIFSKQYCFHCTEDGQQGAQSLQEAWIYCNDRSVC